jgi:hypothetical protein
MSDAESGEIRLARLQAWLKFSGVVATVALGTLGVTFINSKLQQTRLQIEREQANAEIRLAEQKALAEIRLQEEKNRGGQRRAELEALGQYLKEALSQDLPHRIRFAKYFKFLTITKDIKEGWEAYYKDLDNLQRKESEKRNELKLAEETGDETKIQQARAELNRVKLQTEAIRSDNTWIRREARMKLAELGPNAVPGLIEEMSVDGADYRTRLGILVALTEMLRRNKAQASDISALVDAKDLGLLADAAADEDRTIRIFASEFLYDLADPRVVDLALDRIPTASDDGKYNLILVIKGAFERLSPEDQERVAGDLSALQVGPKTRELIDSFLT